MSAGPAAGISELDFELDDLAPSDFELSDFEEPAAGFSSFLSFLSFLSELVDALPSLLLEDELEDVFDPFLLESDFSLLEPDLPLLELVLPSSTATVWLVLVVLESDFLLRLVII